MARVNARERTRGSNEPTLTTHEGAPAAPATPLQQLQRLVMSCMLWEDQFYVNGVKIAEAIEKAAAAVSTDELARVAVRARTSGQMRHVPLLLVDLLTFRAPNYAGAVASVLKRADEPAELLALHLKRRELLNKNRSKTIPAAIRKGIELALQYGPEFGEYGLAKYDRDAALKLKDVFRLVRPKPINEEQAKLWKRAIAGELDIPDTWETALSSGEDKRATWERMLQEKKLGYLALLRNLRNMESVGVDRKLVERSILARVGSARVLPFRFVAAGRAAPAFRSALSRALRDQIGEGTRFPGKTAILVDVSGSMDDPLSGKSDMRRMDAACALAAIWPGYSRIFSFSNHVAEVSGYDSPLELIDAIEHSQTNAGTYLGRALGSMTQLNADDSFDRLIVITDEQSSDYVEAPRSFKKRYLVNVGSYENGVGYELDGWTAHLNGFSENVIRFIKELETA